MYAKAPIRTFSATRPYWFFCKIPVTLIDKTDPRAPIKSKHYWIHALKTKATMMLNIDGGSELLSDTVIVQLFLFLDLDGLF